MDKELLIIIDRLLTQPYTDTSTLSKDLELTLRQLEYRIDKINDLMFIKQLSERINYDNGHIGVDHELKKQLKKLKKISKDDYCFSREERYDYIYLLLFVSKEHLSLFHFMSYLGISKTTLVQDIKSLQVILANKRIEVKYSRSEGYYLSGDELELRNKTMSIVNELFHSESEGKVLQILLDQQELLNYQEIRSLIYFHAKHEGIVFIENRLDEFIYTFILLIHRLLNHNRELLEVNKSHNRIILSATKEHRFVDIIINKLNVFTTFSEYELDYITGWVLGQSVGDISEITDDRYLIKDLTQTILDRFEALSGTHYRNYNKILSQLYSHIRPAYYRLLFRIPINNPLTQTIVNQYHEIYTLVKSVMTPIWGLFRYDIPDDELAFITIHFSSVFSDKTYTEPLVRKKALIVCTNGIGSSAILYRELYHLFPEIEFMTPVSLSEYKNLEVVVDLIFSTISPEYFRNNNTPIIKLNPILTEKEKPIVVREVNQILNRIPYSNVNMESIMVLVNKYATVHNETKLKKELLGYLTHQIPLHEGGINPLLSEVTHKNLIQFNVEANDWQDAIRKAAQPLVDENKIEPKYIDAMIQSVLETGPYVVISKGIAMPHARPEEGTKEIGIGITVLKDPISFGHKQNDPVKYIFCLSAIDNNTHLQSIAELVGLLENEEFFDALDHATDSEEIMEFIRKEEMMNND